jgi:hypothetical protein
MKRVLAALPILVLLLCPVAHAAGTRHAKRVLAVVGAHSGDRLGSSVSTAGRSVVVGAPGANHSAGAVYLVGGGRRGSIGAHASGIVTLSGALPGDQAGASVAGVGDVNGDGRPDFVLGAPGADPEGRSGAGAAYVIFGGPGGSLDLTDVGARGFRIEGPSAGAAAGTRVARAGDINGDGLADVLIAAPNVPGDPLAARGVVYIVYGKRDTGTVDLASLGAAGVPIPSTTDNVSIGQSGLAGGEDLSGDRIPDLSVGTFEEGDEEGGELFTMFGQRAFPGSVGVGDGLTLSGAQGWSAAGGLGGALNAWSLAETRDMSGDKRGELIVGAPADGCSKPCIGFPGTKQNPLSQAGSVFVIFGRPAGTRVNLSPTGPGFAGFRIYGPRKGAAAGVSVAAAGDMNGDHVPDVLIGAPAATPVFVRVGPKNPGAAYVVYGKRKKGGIIKLASLGSHGFMLGGLRDGDRTGAAVAAGNLFGRKRPEVVVGAPRARGSRGAVYVAAAPN